MQMPTDQEFLILSSILKRINDKKDRVMIVALFSLYKLSIVLSMKENNRVMNIESLRKFVLEQYNDPTYILTDAKLVSYFRLLLVNSNFCDENISNLKRQFVFLAKLFMKVRLQNYQKFLLIEFIRNITTDYTLEAIELNISRFSSRMKALKEQLEIAIQAMLTSSGYKKG
ncbi:MAG: hypothetical protein IJU37_07440 [Desulfovibrio sp.]|nr:hypothetical protein [Desulfovibrio sp.]